ncbi:hypothetical protein COLO4_31052 [Corchorus olitorius]|uniref:Uncharacterized protein n=1 Tax=Corchorus olitorius TaxID=93759 RepID=A0A1R3H5S4_9ROSI|nr:hypothetical protein COLO4_31052 [Corchorus olitorius]
MEVVIQELCLREIMKTDCLYGGMLSGHGVNHVGDEIPPKYHSLLPNHVLYWQVRIVCGQDDHELTEQFTMIGRGVRIEYSLCLIGTHLAVTEAFSSMCCFVHPTSHNCT